MLSPHLFYHSRCPIVSTERKVKEVVELKIDKEFSEVLPTSEQRYKELEAEVLKDGCFTDPFITWNGFIIDGHTRYKVMQAHPELDLQPYEKKMDGKFADRYAVIVWIATHQWTRRNLNEFEMAEVHKKAFDAEKKSVGGDRRSEEAKNQRSISTADADKKDIKNGLAAKKLAQDFGVSVGQFKHSVRIGNAMEEAERLVPGAKSAIKSGETGAAKSTVEDILSIDDESERKEYVEAIVSGEKPKADGRRYATKEVRDRYSKIKEIAHQMGNEQQRATFDDVLRLLDAAENDYISKIERMIQSEKENIQADDRWPDAIEGYFDSVIHDINDLKGRIIK